MVMAAGDEAAAAVASTDAGSAAASAAAACAAADADADADEDAELAEAIMAEEAAHAALEAAILDLKMARMKLQQLQPLQQGTRTPQTAGRAWTKNKSSRH